MECEDRHHFKTAGAASRFMLVSLLVALFVVAGVKLVRHDRGSLMRDGVSLALDVNDPFWPFFVTAVGMLLVIIVSLAVFNWKRRRDCTDLTKAFAQRPSNPPSRSDIPNGELLVPDAAVFEVEELSRRFEAQGIRFEVRQTYIDNAFHWRFGNGGLGTRMCVYVHSDDCATAREIAERVLRADNG